MKQFAKGLPITVAVAAVAVLIGVVAGGLFLGEETPDVLSAWSPSERMELSGRWLGMRLTDGDTGLARELGLAPTTDGVVVTDIPEGSAARGSGLMPGDVIVGVDGTDVNDLADLYDITAQLDLSRPVPFEVQRRGQPMMLTMPPPYAGPQPPGEQEALRGPGATMPEEGFRGGGGAGGAWGGLRFFCPADRTIFTQAQVQPHYRCPACSGPVIRAQ